MDFPIGSIGVLVWFILVTSGVVRVKESHYKIVVLGLASMLLGTFVTIPLPGPKGLEVSLNAGHTLVPALIIAVLWPKAETLDKYKTVVGILVVGLVQYGLVTLLDLEPGLVNNPLLVSVAIVSAAGLLTGRTSQEITTAIAGGSLLVVFIRYFDAAFSVEPKVVLELPGTFLWNTACLGITFSIAAIWVLEAAKVFLQSRQTRRAGKDSLANLGTGEESVEQDEVVSVD